MTIVGSLQLSLTMLFSQLDQSWQHEYQARQLIEAERDDLEQQVALRTHDLMVARDQALEASRVEAAQKARFAALHQATIDVLNHHALDAVLQTIVDQATGVLDAPYGEVMLLDQDELVVRAFTANQPFLLGDRVGSTEALLSWQTLQSKQPAIVDNYAAWAARRNVYAEVQLAAVADFPILVRGEAMGVLAVGRSEPGRVFSSDEIEKGVQFAQLTALLLDHATLYDRAVHEIQERARAEEALQQQALELHLQNVELDAFARTVAHDLKLPLTSIIGYSQLMLHVPNLLTSQQVKDGLDVIQRLSKKMATIIDALLLLARVRSQETMPCAVVDMRDVVIQVEGRLHTMISAAQATITTPTSWPAALGYAPWIEEVWANYLSNAVKYGGTPPIITLGAEQLDMHVRFWICDNGQGLSPEQQARLFQPFTRLHDEQADSHGLGLSIVRRIVEKLGGTAGVESVEGYSTTFYFTLPAAPEPHDEQQVPSR